MAKTSIPAKRALTEPLNGYSLASHAASMVGTPHQWGGNTPGEGLDLAGLIHATYAAHGVTLPPTTFEMASAGHDIPVSQTKPGDIILQDSERNGLVDGGGINLGGGNMVTVKPGGQVTVDRISNGGRIVTIRNVGATSDHPGAPQWNGDIMSAPPTSRRPSTGMPPNQPVLPPPTTGRA